MSPMAKIAGSEVRAAESTTTPFWQSRPASDASPAPEVPWFWSDQYDLKLQIAGVPFESDDLVIRGSREAAKFAIFHLKGDRVLAVEAVNAPAEFMGGRLLIGQGRAVDRARLVDLTVSMKEVAA